MLVDTLSLSGAWCCAGMPAATGRQRTTFTIWSTGASLRSPGGTQPAASTSTSELHGWTASGPCGMAGHRVKAQQLPPDASLSTCCSQPRSSLCRL